MTARTATIIKGDNVGNLQFGKSVGEMKTLVLETANTVDATNTIEVSYARYGITNLYFVAGFKHTTDNQVIVTENPTTSVSASVLTITVPAGSDDDKRVYVIFYD